MANCKYCGKPAGWFKDYHLECVPKQKGGQVRVGITAREIIDCLKPILIKKGFVGYTSISIKYNRYLLNNGDLNQDYVIVTLVKE